MAVLGRSFDMQKIVSNSTISVNNHAQGSEPSIKENWVKEWPERISKIKVRCSRCLYDETVPNISFDTEGECNYCKLHNKLDREYPAGEEGQRILRQIANKIRQEGRRNKYDVV